MPNPILRKENDKRTSMSATLSTAMIVASAIMALVLVYLLVTNYADILKQANGELDPYNFRLDLSSKMVIAMGDAAYLTLMIGVCAVPVLAGLGFGIFGFVKGSAYCTSQRLGVGGLYQGIAAILYGVLLQIAFQNWVFSLCTAGIGVCIIAIAILHLRSLKEGVAS